MAFYAICMLQMAVELSLDNEAQKVFYEDQAVIYLKHFYRIKKALNDVNTGVKVFHQMLIMVLSSPVLFIDNN